MESISPPPNVEVNLALNTGIYSIFSHFPKDLDRQSAKLKGLASLGWGSSEWRSRLHEFLTEQPQNSAGVPDNDFFKAVALLHFRPSFATTFLSTRGTMAEFLTNSPGSLPSGNTLCNTCFILKYATRINWIQTDSYNGNDSLKYILSWARLSWKYNKLNIYNKLNWKEQI